MKIASITPLSYKPGNLGYFQFIRGGIGSDYHQEPKFYQFADGKVMLYWSAYDYDECSGNAVKLYSISEDRGLTWSDPQILMADYLGGVPYFMHILRLENSSETFMFHTRTRHNIEVDSKTRTIKKGSDYFKSSTRVYVRHSNNGGLSFEQSCEIPWQLISGGKELPGVGFYGSIDSVIRLQSGRIVMVVTFLDSDRIGDSDRPVQHYTGVCLLSDDNGTSWRRSGEITVDTPRGVMEVQPVETGPNSLFALFRTKGGFLYQTDSTDGGETWSPSVPSPLPAPESMCRMIKLQSGNLLTVWNNVSSITQHPRHPLAAVLSKDGGKSWSAPKIIADETGGNQLSNHGIIQLDDGKILLGISHYRNVRPMTSDLDMAVFDEKWITG